VFIGCIPYRCVLGYLEPSLPIKSI
jgi:hypothetical protein